MNTPESKRLEYTLPNRAHYNEDHKYTNLDPIIAEMCTEARDIVVHHKATHRLNEAYETELKIVLQEFENSNDLSFHNHSLIEKVVADYVKDMDEHEAKKIVVGLLGGYAIGNLTYPDRDGAKVLRNRFGSETHVQPINKTNLYVAKAGEIIDLRCIDADDVVRGTISEVLNLSPISLASPVLFPELSNQHTPYSLPGSISLETQTSATIKLPFGIEYKKTNGSESVIIEAVDTTSLTPLIKDAKNS